MPFGGFCPLPIRLGGGPEEGWPATQHARAVADAVAVARVSSFAVVVYNAGVVAYAGANGSALGNAPMATVNGTGDVTLTWPTVFEDEYGGVRVLDFRSADASTDVGLATVELGVNTVRVRCFDENAVPTTGAFTVEIWGMVGQERIAIGDYDGEPEKTDCETERSPHAWSWYQELTAMVGDGLSREMRGLIHAKKLALARSEMSKTRAVECALANNNPATADELLGQWVEVFRIPVDDEMPRWEIRKRCAARLRGFGSAGFNDVDSAIGELLGRYLVQIYRIRGTSLGSPPALTYWSENPGPPSLSLGGGAWMSHRAHLVVQVTPPSIGDARFLRLMTVDLFDLLDRRLPAWMTFSWTAWTPGYTTPGFRLDISHLDFEGLAA